MPTIATWEGRPLAELSREELEAALIQVGLEVERYRGDLLRVQLEHVKDLARWRRLRSARVA